MKFSESMSGLGILAVIGYGAYAFMSGEDGKRLIFGSQFMAYYQECLDRNKDAIKAHGLDKGIDFCVHKESLNMLSAVSAKDFIDARQGHGSRDRGSPARIQLFNASDSHAVSYVRVIVQDKAGKEYASDRIAVIEPKGRGSVEFGGLTQFEGGTYRIESALGFPYTTAPAQFR